MTSNRPQLLALPLFIPALAGATACQPSSPVATSDCVAQGEEIRPGVFLWCRAVDRFPLDKQASSSVGGLQSPEFPSLNPGAGTGGIDTGIAVEPLDRLYVDAVGSWSGADDCSELTTFDGIRFPGSQSAQYVSYEGVLAGLVVSVANEVSFIGSKEDGMRFNRAGELRYGLNASPDWDSYCMSHDFRHDEGHFFEVHHCENERGETVDCVEEDPETDDGEGDDVDPVGGGLCPEQCDEPGETSDAPECWVDCECGPAGGTCSEICWSWVANGMPDCAPSTPDPDPAPPPMCTPSGAFPATSTSPGCQHMNSDLIDALASWWQTSPSSACVYVNGVTTNCLPQPLTQPNGFYCEQDDLLAYAAVFRDQTPSQVGEWAIAAHEWGHLNQARRDLAPPWNKAMELHADCQAGLFFGLVASEFDFSGVEGGAAAFVQNGRAFLANGGDDFFGPWWAIDTHGMPFERACSFDWGYNNFSLATCNLTTMDQICSDAVVECAAL